MIVTRVAPAYMRSNKVHLPRVLSVWAIVIFLAMALPAVAAQNAKTDPDAPVTNGDDALSQIWKTRLGDLDTIMEEASKLREVAEEQAKPLAVKLRTLRVQFTRLTGLYQASRGHPTEQLTLAQQMQGLRDSLQRGLQPLEVIAATINQRKEDISSLQSDLREFSRENTAEEAAPSGDAQGFQEYHKSLNLAAKRLGSASLRLEAILSPARSVLERMNASIGEIEGTLLDIWRNYYLTTSGTNLDALASTPQMLTDWLVSLDSRMGFAYPQNLDEWEDALKSFLGTSFIMAIFAFLGLRGAHELPTRWRVAFERVIKNAWVWIGIGLAMLSASSNQNGGVYFAFTLSGALILIAGIAAMSWRLRIAVLPSLAGMPSPLARLYPPAAIGVLMLFSDLPTRILGIVWGVIMVGFVVMIVSLNRRHKEDGLPLLERLSYGCAFYFGLASLFVSVFGYARMAILLFMVLFALVNTVTLASALTDLFTILADRVFSKETKPVRNAIAEALSIPLALVLSLFCTLPWAWAVPGARYLLDNAMSTNYTLGEASFDFTKLLVIALLFFLFRSLSTLGKASLDHLPERMPNIERGVLPPLRTMFVYAMWVIFGLIALGMLGVNFTSLAVVAGGLSVGIGFGMQNIFNNLISGLMLIFGRTILVGDYVEVGSTAGTVRAISIRSTTLETPERALVFVPNSTIMAGQFTNWTRNSRMVRKSLMVGVAYGTDIDLVQSLLLKAAGEQEHVLRYPSPSVIFTDFGASSLDFTLNVFIDNFDNATSTLSSLRVSVQKMFAENRIDIPFPQLSLHMPGQDAAQQSPDIGSGRIQESGVVLEKTAAAESTGGK